MATSNRIYRTSIVEQSVEDFIRNAIFNERQYPADRVELIDAFDEQRFEQNLDRNFIAIGYNFDDGGTSTGLGEPSISRIYTIEVWIVGLTPDEGANLAAAVKESLDAAQIVPLKDYRQPDAPQIDALLMGYGGADFPRMEHQPVPDPKPWQENLWTVTVDVYDEYDPRAW